MNLNQLTIVSIFSLMSTIHANEVISTNTDRTDLAVTVYNQNLALVRDTRKVTLPTGLQTLAFKDVSAQIRPETLSLTGDVRLLEQNFEYDLIDLNALINKNIGEAVRIVTHTDSGEVMTQTGKILANNDQPIIEIDGKISTLPKNAQIVFDKIPTNLRDKPTMTMLVNNQAESEQELGMTYLTGGLNWKADYVANLLDDNTLSLSGWITLNNNSGTTFNDAKLQLVAGDVNTVREEMAQSHEKMFKAKSASADIAVQEESLFEYHLYTLPKKTTIKNRQQKQVALLSSSSVTFEKQYIAEMPGLHYNYQRSEESKLSVNTYVKFKNNKDSGLGLPLPKGVIRTYQNDSKGNAQFIGEDRIDHTPENESVKLKLGEAFDVTVKSKQTDYKNTAKNSVKMSFKHTFKNAKNTAINVTLPQRFHNNWKITKSSHKHEKTSANVATWAIDVPAKGETKLTYTVNITW